MDEIALMREIGKLQEQINALRTIETGGIWTAYTPTLSSIDGGTVPTFADVRGGYCAIGNTLQVTYYFSNSSGGTAGSGANLLVASVPFNHHANQNVLGIGIFWNGAAPQTVLARKYGDDKVLLMRADGNNVYCSDFSSVTRYLHLTLNYRLV